MPTAHKPPARRKPGAKRHSQKRAAEVARDNLQNPNAVVIEQPEIGRIELVNGEPRWLVPVTAIYPDAANTNTHDDASRQAIAGSLKRFGQKKPVVLRPDFVIAAGNGTYEAAVTILGWSELWVTQSGLDGWEAAAFGLADNRTAEHSKRDEDAVTKLLRELESAGSPLDGMGFDDTDLAALLAGEVITADESTPEQMLPNAGKRYDQSVGKEVIFIQCPNCKHQWPK